MRPDRSLGTPILLAVAALLSAAAVAMLLIRADQVGGLRFGFLVWNLVLAWVPLPFAVLVRALQRRKAPAVLFLLPAPPWLAFLPNAPYLITDFVHLRPRDGVPLWADAALIGTFAVAGLMVGLVSLHLVHQALHDRFGPLVGWISVAGFVLLSAVGVYVGRALRFNSWDLLHRFDELLGLAMIRLADPLGNPALLQLVGAMLVLLAGGYVLFHLAWLGLRRVSRPVRVKATG